MMLVTTEQSLLTKEHLQQCSSTQGIKLEYKHWI